MRSAISLLLGRAQRASIEREARRRYPLEACGILIGTRTGRHLRVDAVHCVANAALQPATSFEIAAGDLMAADDGARQQGRSVLGLWHSHPDGPPRPSADDARHAVAGWAYVIAGQPGRERAELRAFLAEGSELRALELVAPGPGTTP